jgi:hypothetical protein
VGLQTDIKLLIYKPIDLEKTGAGAVQVALLLGLAACGSGGSGSPETSTVQVIPTGRRPEAQADVKPDNIPSDSKVPPKKAPPKEVPPKEVPPKETPPKETPPDTVPTITQPKITLTSGDRITATPLEEGDEVLSSSELYRPDLSQGNGSFVYKLKDENDGALFQIDGVTGSLSFKADTTPVFETQKQGYLVSYQATSDDIIFSQDIHISITDIDEAPSAMSLEKGTATVLDNNQRAIKLTDIKFDDIDQKASFQNNTARIDDSLYFEIRNGTELWLKADSPLDYETSQRHDVTIESVNSVHQQQFTLIVEDIDEPEVFASWQLTPIEGEIIAPPILSDPDGPVQITAVRWFSRAKGVDDWEQQTLWLRKTPFLYRPERKDIDRFLRAEISYLDGNGVLKNIFTPATKAVINTNNRAPIFTSESEVFLTEEITYQSDASLYKAVATPDVPRSDVTFTLSGTDDARPMRIDAATGDIFFSEDTVLDTESTETHYDVIVTARTRFGGTDQEASHALRFSVRDVNDVAPEITSADMATPLVENKKLSEGALIYQASGTFDTEPIIWSIAGTDSALFEIGKSGAVTVKSFSSQIMKVIKVTMR